MRIRIYEANLDLETVGDMLWQADTQANFHPDARWIHSSSTTSEEDWISAELKKVHKGRIYKEFHIRWIGREAIIMWLTSNQIPFEVVTFENLVEEDDAIDDSLSQRETNEMPEQLN